MFRKFLAVLLLLIGLLGLALSVSGALMGRRALDEIGTSLETALSRTVDSLDTASDTLILTKSTFEQVTTGLDTVGNTADNVAQSILDTKPLLDSITSVVSGDIPDSLEAIEGAIPGVADAAGTIDDTLRTLSDFAVEREIFGIPISFDLGINYNPEIDLDDSVLQIGQSLEGMPESLRAIRTDLDVANDNLETISSSVGGIAADLDALGTNVEQIEPLVDDYIQLVSDIKQLAVQTQERLDAQLETAKLIVTLLFVWIGINQLIPLYLSWDIFTRDSRSQEESSEDDDDSIIEEVAATSPEDDSVISDGESEDE
jgi:methyl-accepting chemotaxis protein